MAKSLAPEEIRVGDFVCALRVLYELPSFLWEAPLFDLPADQPVRIPYLPHTPAMPLRVKSICLPYVLVRAPHGLHQMLDVRQVQLARLCPKFARQTWRYLKKQATL